MNIFKKVYCRIYQRAFRLALPILPYREPTIYDSVEGLNERMNIQKKFDCIKEEDITFMAKKADKEANPLYPVPKLMNVKELKQFYYLVANIE